SRRRAEQGNLPKVCTRCGAAATAAVTRKVSWTEYRWYHLFTLLSVLPYLGETHWATIQIPVCDQHRTVEQWHERSYKFAYLAAAVLCGLAALLSYFESDIRGLSPSPLTIVVLAIGVGGGAVVWLGETLIVRPIRATRITPDTIRLKRIAPEFVVAVKSEMQTKHLQ